MRTDSQPTTDVSATNATPPASATNASSAAPKTSAPCWIDHLLSAAVLAACLMATSKSHADPDLWGHVQYGLDALRGGLPATSTYAYTSEGAPWINHELISEYLLAIGWRTIGASGLLTAKCLMALGLFWAVLRRATRLGVSPFCRYSLAILTATNLTFFWEMRPQLLSFMLLALLLMLLNWCFAGWEGQGRLVWPSLRRRSGAPSSAASSSAASSSAASSLGYSSARMRWLWLAPPLFCVWANTHGAFLAGLCIFAAYLGCRSLEAVGCRGWAAEGLLKRFALMLAASILATMINPYGARLHVWMVESLLPPRPEIIEWQAPQVTWEVTSLAWLPFWTLLATGVAALLVSRKPKDFTHLTILTLIVWQALEHRRHIALVALLFAFWMPVHFQELLRRLGLGRDDSPYSASLNGGRRWAFAAAVAVALGFIVANLTEQMREITVEKEMYPVSAFEYLAERQLEGKLVVSFNWAQYAIMAFGAEHPHDRGLRVNFDGRYDTCYPREVVDMHFDFEIGEPRPGSRYRGRTSPPVDNSLVLEYGRPDLALVSRECPESVAAMARNAERWTLLYRDSIADLWGRAEKYDDPNSHHYIPASQRRLDDLPQKGIVAWPALPGKAVSSQLSAVSQIQRDSGTRLPH